VKNSLHEPILKVFPDFQETEDGMFIKTTENYFTDPSYYIIVYVHSDCVVVQWDTTGNQFRKEVKTVDESIVVIQDILYWYFDDL
jgi:hypothetical protein